MLGELKKKTAPVERLLNEFSKDSPKEIAIPSMHLVKLGMERIIPGVVVLSCEACGGRAGSAVNAAAAVEIMHHYNLIHDDLIDKDLMREGQLSVHTLYGEALAITTGDYLLSKSFEIVGEGLPPQKSAEVGRILARAARLTAEGRALDIVYSKFTNINEEQFFDMVRAKTGAMFSAAAEIGAVIAGADNKRRKALAEYGELLGIALQIRNDLLEVTIEREGKKFGADILEGKRTLTAVKTLEDPRCRSDLMKHLGNPNATISEIREAVEAMRESGSIEYAKNKEAELVNTANEKLKVLPKNNARKLLEKLTDYSIKHGF